MSFLATQLIGFGAGEQGFAPVSVEYSGAQTTTVSVPSGATALMIEAVGSGGNGFVAKDFRGGGGGGYSKTNSASLVGTTSIYISIPAINSQLLLAVKQNTSGGVTLCAINSGGPGSAGGAGGSSGGQSSGDVLNAGGAGTSSGGGGAGGPGGVGSNGNTRTSGGSPGGNGGFDVASGSNYGGGGGQTNGTGAPGYVKLSWS